MQEQSAPEGSRSAIKKSALESAYMSRYARSLVPGGSIRIPICSPYSSGMYAHHYLRVI